MRPDFDTYRATVLEAARRAGNVPPADLFVRYDIDPNEVGDQEEFTRRVAAVVKFWRSLKHQRKYLPLATALLTADTDLSRRGLLTLAAFAERRQKTRGQAQGRLNDRVTAIAGSAPYVTLSGLRRLMTALEGAFPESEVRAALTAKGLTVIEPPWELPAGPPVASARSLHASLTALGARLSPDVVFGVDEVRAGFRLKDGFRLAADGRTVTSGQLVTMREQHARSKHDEHKTATETVLAILITAAEQPDALHQLFLWEVAEQLRPDTEAGLPVRLVAHCAGELGLDPEEAMELAVTLAANTGRAPRAVTGDSARQVAQALRDGELTEARSLLADLPPGECEDARAELRERERQVADCTRRAESALAGNNPEDAAALLAEAVALAADDDGLRARLTAIPPPAPGGVTAGVEPARGRVGIRWAPSAARTPDVRYRVVRTAGTPAPASSAGTIVAETTSNEAADAVPPVAQPVCYTVFASRGGDTWSAGAAADPIEWLPGVADLELATTEHSVAGVWRVQPGATAVTVTRTGPDTAEPVAVPVSAESAFTDRTVRTGVTYEYAVTAVYRTPAGHDRASQPTFARATPAAPPSAVEELTWTVAENHGSPVLELTWRPPAGGTVEVRATQRPLAWPVGTVVPRTAAVAAGQLVSGTASIDPQGLTHLVSPPPHGRVVLTAITVAGDRACIGAGTAVSLVDPVRDLRADRHGDAVRLFWTWPPGAIRARVSWWPTATGSSSTPLGEFDTSLREHTAAGGVTFDVRPGPVTVSVRTVGRPGDDGESPVVTADVPGEPAKVTYAVEPAGLPGRRRHDLVLTTDQPCRLPRVIVVHRKDGVQPLRPDSGTTIATLPPREMVRARRVSVPLGRRVHPLSGLACFLDPCSPAVAEVILVPASR
jgi:hypothetical protein